MYTSLKRRSILPGGGEGAGPRASCQYLNISKSDLEDNGGGPEKLPVTSTPFSTPVKEAYTNNNNPAAFSPREQATAVGVCSYGREAAATYSSFRDSPVTRDVRRQLKFHDGGGPAARTAGEDAADLGSKGSSEGK
jgi:hypothetical protein